MAKLKCEHCEHEIDIPSHCGKEMSIQELDGEDMLVCWMGPDCGKQEMPQHCEKSMAVVA